jgi:hypothetical protein
MVDPKKPMALVQVDGLILLNAEDAVKVFEILCRAEFVEYSYSDSGYKHKYSDRHSTTNIRVFTTAEHAALALNSTD